MKLDLDDIYYDPIIRQDCIQQGALRYVVDRYQVISKGYHEFFLKDGGLWGKVGTIEERVIYQPPKDVDKEGKNYEHP